MNVVRCVRGVGGGFDLIFKCLERIDDRELTQKGKVRHDVEGKRQERRPHVKFNLLKFIFYINMLGLAKMFYDLSIYLVAPWISYLA